MYNCKPLNIEYLKSKLIYEPDTGRILFNRPITSKKYGKEAGYEQKGPSGKTYRRIFVGGIWTSAHRVAWALYHDRDIPEGMVIDHIDGNGLNNRICNIKLVVPADNSINKKLYANNQVGITGITFVSRLNQFRVQGKRKGYPGISQYFDSLLDAVSARKSWERRSAFHENHGADRPL